MKTISLFVLFLFSIGSFAMKPAPMTDDFKAKFKKSKYIVHAVYDDKKTYIKGSLGKVLWTLDEYIAKKRPFLSPDGKTLLLFGDDFVGSHITTGAYLRTGPNPIYFEVVKEGNKTKTIKHLDVYDQEVAELTKKYDMREKGGGWVSLYELIQNYEELESDINWDKNSIDLKLLTEKTKTIEF